MKNQRTLEHGIVASRSSDLVGLFLVLKNYGFVSLACDT